MSRLKQKKTDSFNLAFLDVMACGLGAVILIFMLVDFQDTAIDTTEEKDRLEQELAANERQQTELKKSIEEVNDNIAMESDKQEDIKTRQQDIEADLEDTKKAIDSQNAILADLDKQKAAVSKREAKATVITKTGTGEQNYIVGMPVDGKHIGILVDKSTSMMDTELVNILVADTLPDNEKVTQPKWVRTKNIATWLVSRLPKNAKVTMVAFSEDAKVLGPNNSVPAASGSVLQTMLADLGKVIPNGGTNLRIGLDTLMQANPLIDSIYLITDGLPTLGESLRSRQCASITSRKTISAQCRKEMGEKTLTYFVGKHPGTKFSTILLPIEGDPYASSTYWNMTWATGGKMLSPALEWN